SATADAAAERAADHHADHAAGDDRRERGPREAPSFIIAGTAAASSWLSRPSRMIVSAVAATSSFWYPLHAPSSRIAATSTVFMASMRGLRVGSSMRHREDHVQRHQRLQRVRARLDQRPDVLADEA